MEAVAKSDPKAFALPIIYTPNPVIGASPEVLHKKLLEGNDPETGKPVIDEIIEVLTKPINSNTPTNTGRLIFRLFTNPKAAFFSFNDAIQRFLPLVFVISQNQA